MKKKITEFLLGVARKHKLLKYPCFALLTVYLFLYHMIFGLLHSTKKITAAAMLMCVFIVSTSFAYEDFSFTYETEQAMNEIVVQTQVQEEVREDITSEIIEDKDVTDGYENSEFEIVSDEEKFYAEDILSETDAYETSIEEVKDATKLSKQDWSLVLINKQHSIPENYQFTLGTIRGSMQCDERIIPSLMEMLKEAKAEGVNLVICSPYRDLNRQKVLFGRKVTAYMKHGMSYMEAYKTTAQAVTVPGASEHQIGLALDIISDSYTSLNEGFGKTQAGIWLANNSYKYGFILRYPLGKEYITGIEYEPWHFRYVGVEAATLITEEGITLEEFVDKLPN